MNMHEHLECYDESLIGMCGVLLIMFVLIAAVLAVILGSDTALGIKSSIYLKGDECG